MRAARRARLALDGRRSARFRARSAFATSLSARNSERSSRVFAASARRLRRQARNLEASGQASHASAPAPARSNAPRLPCSTPYQIPKITAGRGTACRSQRGSMSMTAGSKHNWGAGLRVGGALRRRPVARVAEHDSCRGQALAVVADRHLVGDAPPAGEPCPPQLDWTILGSSNESQRRYPAGIVIGSGLEPARRR